MKIDIGPYKSDIIPVYSWERRYESLRSPDKFFLAQDEYTWYDKLVLGALDKLSNLVRPLNQWSNGRKRKINVRVDDYDVWSADHTLGIIIHPVLVKLKELKHGYPYVDENDIPEELRSVSSDGDKNEEEIDYLAEARWNWILDEMIWAFGQHGMEDDTVQYYHNRDQLDIIFNPLEDGKPAGTLGFTHQKDPTKPPYFRDVEGLKKHDERKENGRRLFAKYYDNLWD